MAVLHLVRHGYPILSDRPRWDRPLDPAHLEDIDRLRGSGVPRTVSAVAPMMDGANPSYWWVMDSPAHSSDQDRPGSGVVAEALHVGPLLGGGRPRSLEMEAMEFAELSRKVIALYFEGSYREALGILADGRKEFPEEDSTLTWYEGCLLSVSGDPERALEVLTAGLNRGLGWHPRMLRDSDLDSARSLAGWDSFVTRSGTQVEEWDLQRPEPLIRSVPNPTGTVIALHGAGNHPELFFETWESATPPGWSLVVPVGEVPVSKSEWAWPFDLETDSLIKSLNPVAPTEPVVLAGFSQGSRLAAKAAWDGDVATAGLLLTAAGLSPELWRESQRRPVPTYVVSGIKDGGHEGCLATSTVLRDAGVPVSLDIREGLDHMLPDDLDRTVAAALAWIMSQT